MDEIQSKFIKYKPKFGKMEKTEKTKATEIARMFANDKEKAAKEMARVLFTVEDDPAKGKDMMCRLHDRLKEGLTELYERNTGKRLQGTYAELMATLLRFDAVEEAWSGTSHRFNKESALEMYATDMWKAAFAGRCTKKEFLAQFPGVVAVAKAKLASIA